MTAREYCPAFWRLFAAWDALAEADEAEGHGESDATRAAWRAVCEHREGCRDCPPKWAGMQSGQKAV